MAHKHHFPLLISPFLLAGAVAWADFVLQDWRYEKQIQLPAISQEQFVELTFDDEVFSNSASGLRDLRIISSSGVEVPYKLLEERGGVERSSFPVSIFNKSFIPGQYTSFIADLGQEGILHNQIEIHTSSINFRRSVQVEGSKDAETWQVLQPKGIIYDYTDREAGLKTQNTLVKYPEATFRYLKVTIFDQGEEPLTISGATVFYEKITFARRTNYPAEIVERIEDKEHKASRFVIDLGSSGLPTNSMSLGISGTNFQRDVALEGSNNKTDWSVIKNRDVIFSFDTPKFTGSNLTISYPESTYRYLRLTIFNKDNPALELKQVFVSGVVRKLVFQANPSQSYKLYYGNPSASYPQYDLERYFAYLELGALPVASLSGQILNPSFVEKVPPPPPFTERYPWLLPSVLGLVGFFLGFLVFRLFRQVKETRGV